MAFSACNCHGHAIDCYYDPDVERQRGSLNIQGIYAGGGVCINCQVSHHLGQRGYVTVGKEHLLVFSIDITFVYKSPC